MALSAAVLGLLGATSTGILITKFVTHYWGVSEIEAAVGDVSVERYKVLGRLSSGENIRYLRSLPGVSQATIEKFEKEQRRVYRLYLREIVADFSCLHRAARALLSSAPAEQSHLVGVLFKQRINFCRSLIMIELRLALQFTGVPAIDLNGLLGSVDQLRTALTRASASPSMA